MVFDGSAKATKDDVSLNDCLEKGPNLVPHLFDTVIKFRGYPIGIVADIEKAFHQIQIAPEDRRMLKFLWFDDIDKESPEINSKSTSFDAFPLVLPPVLLFWPALSVTICLGTKKHTRTLFPYFETLYMLTTLLEEHTKTLKLYTFTTHLKNS